MSLSSIGNRKPYPPTVSFDVGGTIYKVYQYVLGEYPDTMLSRMVSECWVGRNDGESKDELPPLFIDRNADRFQYVLDYMRNNQEVYLPMTVSKQGFLQDLEYFGFEDVDESRIKVDDWNHQPRHIQQRHQEYQASPFSNWAFRYIMRTLVPDLDDALLLAECCWAWVRASGELEYSVANDDDTQTSFLWLHLKLRKTPYEIAEAVLGNNYKKQLFKQWLEDLGLRLKSVDFCVGEKEEMDEASHFALRYQLRFEQICPTRNL